MGGARGEPASAGLRRAGWALLLLAAAAQGLPALVGRFTVTALLLGVPAVVLLVAARAGVGPARRRAALLLALCVPLGLAAGEGLLRATQGDELATIYRLDDELLHRVVPGARRVVRRLPVNGGDRILVAVNRDGFRGDELQQDGRLRVAVFGDSFVAAEGSRLPDTFVARLGVELAQAAGAPVEAVNAGVIGYGPDQALLRMVQDVPRLSPALVVFTLYAGNDGGDLVRNQLFTFDEHGALQRRHPPLAWSLRAEFLLARREPLVLKRLDQAVARLLRKLAWRVQRLAGEPRGDGGDPPFLARCLAQTQDEFRRHVLEGDGTVRRLLGDAYDADLATDPASASAQHKRRLIAALLGRVREEAGRLGVPLLVLVVPSPIDACEQHDLGRVDPARHPGYRRENLSGTFVDLARAASLPCLDLFPLFAARDGCDVYLRGNDDHWNDLGQALAATAVADEVMRLGWVGGVHQR